MENRLRIYESSAQRFGFTVDKSDHCVKGPILTCRSFLRSDEVNQLHYNRFLSVCNSNLSGSVYHLFSDLSNLSGNLSNFQGGMTYVSGSISNLFSDIANLSCGGSILQSGEENVSGGGNNKFGDQSFQ